MTFATKNCCGCGQTRRHAFVVAATLLVGACRGATSTTTPTAPSQPVDPQGLSQVARGYLEELLDVMQRFSINRLKLDWNGIRTEVFNSATGAQSIPDTYSAVRIALGRLGDGHSSVQTPTGTTIFVPNRLCVPSGASIPTPPDTIGYVKVGPYSGNNPGGFADDIQTTIRTADRDNLLGWIVDLRANSGGNMWPMIAGVGPVLGDGVLGYFIDPTDVESVWSYHDGASWVGGFMQQSVTAPYRLRHELPRVAVLMDNGTASSGEATLIAFKSRANTRFFGSPTCGLSTANQMFPLRSGGALNLTVSVMADRTKTRYGDSIAPDEVVTDPTLAVGRAISWLQNGT